MRLIIVLLTTAILQVSAAGYAQKVTLIQKNARLTTVLDEIRKQTGYDFVYSDKVMNAAKRVSLNLKNAELNDALEICFKDQPLSFKVEDKMVIIKPKEASFIDNIIARFLAIDVYGKVVDESGQPLAGATVRLKSGKGSTITVNDGRFSIKNVEPDAVLVISYLGYVNKEIAANADLTRIVMVVSDNKLDEIEIQAYSTTSKRLSTSNIGTVKAVDIAKQPVQNPLLAIQGRIPGITIEQNNGLPGSSVKVRIQGQNSFTRGNEPLYVIDGVPYTSMLMPQLTGIFGAPVTDGSNSFGGGGSPLSYINPSDIESIDVLKDADATSIYGSRAAAGAILITTKKGTSGATRVNFTTQHGFGEVGSRIKLLNTEQYLEMRKEAFKNDGLPIPTSSATPTPTNFDLTTYDQNRFTDWQDKLIGGKAQYTDANMSISGGSATIQFLLGGAFHRETSVFPGDAADKKASIHFNLANSSANNRFKTQFDVKYMLDNNRLFPLDLTAAAVTLAPNAPDLYHTDGTLNWEPLPNGSSTFNNPLANTLNMYSNKTQNLISNALLSYAVTPKVSFQSRLGYTNMQVDEIQTSPVTSYQPEIRNFVSPSVSYANGNISSWSVEPQLNYKSKLGIGILDGFVGATFFQSDSKRQAFYAGGFSTDLLMEDIKSATILAVTSTLREKYKYSALFTKLNYTIAEKYILNLSARRDGSSRFGPNDIFSNFGSVAAAWIFSNENFIEENLPFINFGKLKASYGITGNEQIGNYQFMSLYGSTSYANPYQGSTSLVATGLANNDLHWEKTKKFNGALDLGFFNSRLLLNANYYENRSSNQLVSYALPSITGFTGITRNLDALIKNYGWEMSINSTNVKSGTFQWHSNFNITFPKSKLLEYPSLSTSSQKNDYIIGAPVTITRIFNLLGVDPNTGRYQFADQNGAPVFMPVSADKLGVVNLSPKFYGGLSNSINFKGLSLDLMIQFVKQVGPSYALGDRPGIFAAFSTIGNQPKEVLDRWQNVGDVTGIQRYSSSPLPNSSFVSIYYSDASFIRLKNASLSWKLPDSWNKSVGLTNSRVFIQGQNLFTVTKYIGLDPETKSAKSSSLPPLRVYTMGMQFTF